MDNTKMARCNKLLCNALLKGMTCIANTLTAIYTNLLHCKRSRNHLCADRQGNHYDTISIGEISKRTVHSIRKIKLTIVGTHTPFIEKKLFLIFEHAPHVSLNDKASILGHL